MVVVSLDMFLNSLQDTFVKYKNDKFYLVKGSINSGKTISIIFKALYLKRNYCFDKKDKILFLTSEFEIQTTIDIFNYINKSDLYVSIIPSEDIEVHILTFEQFEKYNMKSSYTHIFIDDLENFSLEQIQFVFSFFNNMSYSKVFLVQNSAENIDNTSIILEWLRKIMKVREGVFNFRGVIDHNDRDEFTQISMTPEVKYLDYSYKEYVDFHTKDIFGYYTKRDKLYVDKGSFLQNVTCESLDVDFFGNELEDRKSIPILKSWVYDSQNLKFVEINDEGMGKYDLFRGDIVLINIGDNIESEDIVVIFKSGYTYARKFINCNGVIKFVSGESIFKDIYLDEDTKILGKVVGYIR